MKKTELFHLLNHPQHISFKEYAKLEDIQRDYPFFSILHSIVAKAAKELNTPDQNHKLNLAAFQALNRPKVKALMDYAIPTTENEVKADEEHEVKAKLEQKEEESVANAFADTEIKAQEHIVDGTAEDSLAKQKAQQEIIDNFINANAGIIKADPNAEEEKREDLTKQSERLPEHLASENLAKVLVQQGKTAKAIEIYQKLSLKYPEKSSYFATLIEELKKN